MRTNVLLSWLLLLLLLVVQSSSASQVPLQFNDTTYKITLTEKDTSQSLVYILTIGFNRNLTNSEEINEIILVGQNYRDFSINTATRVITTSTNLSAGKYQFLLIVVYGSTFKSIDIFVMVDVIAADTACETQAFGKCSQLCQLSNSSQTGYTCSCLNGYTLQSDELTCLAEAPSPLILFSYGNIISKLDLSKRESSLFYQLSENDNSIDLFDYSYTNQLLFYVDQTRSLIAKTTLGTPGNETILISDGLGRVEGLALDWVSGNLYFSDVLLGTIQQYHTSTGHVTPVLYNLNNPRSIAVIPEEPYRYLFWVEGTISNATIKRSYMNGSNVVIIATNVINPVAMAIDVIIDKIFWISNVGQVNCASLDGTNLEVVFTDDAVTFSGIAVFEDSIYLTDSLNNTIVRVNKFNRPGSLIVKYDIDDGLKTLKSIHVIHPLQQILTAPDVDECLINNGGCSQGCVNTLGSFYCVCIHGYNLKIDERTCINSEICEPADLNCQQGCSLDNTGNETCTCNPGYSLANDGISCQNVDECAVKNFCSHGCHDKIGGFQCSCPTGLFLSSDLRNCIGCSINNGGCSQLCITNSDHYQCQCRNGYTIGSDGSTCFPDLPSKIIFSITRQAINDHIGSIIESTLDGHHQKTVVFPSFQSQTETIQTGLVFAMDLDVSDNILYYSDRTTSTLWKVQLDNVITGNDKREKLADGVQAWGMVYDWINKYLYWTEDKNGMIKRAATNESTLTVQTVLTGLNSPRGITVEPFSNYLYWTEGEMNTSRVARSSLSDISSTVNTLISLPSTSYPTGITIDYLNNKLIWADQSNRTIQFSTFNGNNQITFLTTSEESRPFQLAITGSTLYWTTEGSSMFSKTTLYDSTGITSLNVFGLGNNPRLYGVTTFDDNKRPDSGFHVCLVNSLGCSHYCTVNSEGESVCSCPAGYSLLTDKKTCANIKFCPEPTVCEGNFANISGTPFFLQPNHNGGTLNSLENPLQRSGESVSNCQVVSVQYLDFTCQYTNITSTLFAVMETQLIGLDIDNPSWGLLNGRTVTVTLECSDIQFCVNFEISTASRAISCGFSNGGCSHFCTVDFSPIPVCSCPHGMVLGQDGYSCINPCDPNPCQNGGMCRLTLDGSTLCLCNNYYTGPFCSIPPQPNCPGDLCHSIYQPSISVQRFDTGDRVNVPGLSEGYCSTIGGYCVGDEERAGTNCPACQCGPNLVYQYETKNCDNLNGGCTYIFSQSTTAAPTLYVSSTNQLLSVATNSQLSIVHTSTSDPPNDNCTVGTMEVNTGNGWITITSNGVILTKNEGNTYLQIGSQVPVNHLSGQLMRVNLVCPNGNSGCLLFRFHGNSTDIAQSSTAGSCNDCEVYFEGYKDLGIPLFSRPTSNDQPLTDRSLMFNGQELQGCNEVQVSYYDNDSCGLIPVEGNIIYVTQSSVKGRNVFNKSNIWNTIIGKIINITITCQLQNKVHCLLLQIVEPFTQDPCSSSCANGGNCTSLGETGYHCTCPTGFTGPNCSNIDYCLSHNCLNNGTCINGPGYASCLCPPNTIPPYCIGPDDRNLGPCILDPCDNGGTCIEEGSKAYFCQCPIGFTGLHCNTPDPCSSSPCPENATCVPMGSQYECHCPQGQSSPGCVNMITPCEPNPCHNGGNCTASGDNYTCECAQGFTGVNCTNIDPCSISPCQNGGTCQLYNMETYTCLCPPGFTGTNCTIDINECDPNPCNNGTCNQGSPGTYTCICPPGFTGTNCTIDINECDPNPCNNGTCNQGSPGTYTCICPPGFTGTNCTIDINECDPNPCNDGTCNQGSPGTYTCICPPGFTGTNCTIDINECDPNPCNNGTCNQGSPGTYSCICPPGFTGTNCTIDINECDPNPCNNGTCNQGSPGTYTCICPPGFTGTNCTVDINECDPNPCNDGTCNQGSPGTYTCICPPGFTGTNCTIDINECDPNPCNDGTCNQGSPGTYTCICPPGFTGTNCTIDINECDPNPCNDGTCNQGSPGTYTCICPPGFTGTNCTVDINECDPNPCNDGTCNQGSPGTYTCICPPGFTGTNCTIDINECDPNPCNDGTCNQGSPGTYTCICPPGFTGTNCTIDINECDPNPCNDGTCNQGSPGTYTCICPPGFTGTNCTIDIDECDPNPCNDGTCNQGSPGTYTCICPPGFTGANCTIDIDECDPNPCQNGGSCINQQSGFRCNCGPGFIGSTCSETCPSGKFGRNCTEQCNCENGADCDPIGGRCICKSGYTGERCENPICNPSCLNGGTCASPNSCVCRDTYTGARCDSRICTDNFCNQRGVCDLDLDDNPFCVCFDGFTGDQCDQRGALTAAEKGGVSAGVIVGILIFIIIVTAVLFFSWKVVYPYYRRKKSRSTMWYLDSTLVHENPAAAEVLLRESSESIKYSERGLTKPLDNPLYSTVPSQENIAEDSISISSNEDFETPFYEFPTDNEPRYNANVIPNAVIVNRYVDTGSPDSTGETSPIPNPRQREESNSPSQTQCKIYISGSNKGTNL